MSTWNLADKQLTKTFTFSNFEEAFAFMTKVAAVAEELNHHPNWTNVYNRVEISLSTHEVGDVSEKDYELAKRIDALASLI